MWRISLTAKEGMSQHHSRLRVNDGRLHLLQSALTISSELLTDGSPWKNRLWLRNERQRQQQWQCETDTQLIGTSLSLECLIALAANIMQLFFFHTCCAVFSPCFSCNSVCYHLDGLCCQFSTFTDCSCVQFLHRHILWIHLPSCWC